MSSLPKGHTTSKWLGYGLNPGGMAAKPELQTHDALLFTSAPLTPNFPFSSFYFCLFPASVLYSPNTYISKLISWILVVLIRTCMNQPQSS